MLTLGIFIFARDNGLIDFLKNGGEIAFQKQIFHFAMLLLFECAVLAVDLPLEWVHPIVQFINFILLFLDSLNHT